jgi:hypothetical protein
VCRFDGHTHELLLVTTHGLSARQHLPAAHGAQRNSAGGALIGGGREMPPLVPVSRGHVAGGTVIPARSRAEAMAWLRRLARDPSNVGRLRAFLLATSWAQTAGGDDDDAVIARAAELLARGDLALIERAHFDAEELSAGGAQRQRDEASVPAPPRVARDDQSDEALTWVAIELVGEDDEPIAGARYELQLPDGTLRTGCLDANGFARVDGIDPGACVVAFVDLDRRAWERIS